MTCITVELSAYACLYSKLRLTHPRHVRAKSPHHLDIVHSPRFGPDDEQRHPVNAATDAKERSASPHASSLATYRLIEKRIKPADDNSSHEEFGPAPIVFSISMSPSNGTGQLGCSTSQITVQIDNGENLLGQIHLKQHDEPTWTPAADQLSTVSVAGL